MVPLYVNHAFYSDAWLLFSLHRLLCLEQMSQQETPKRKGKSVYSTSELEGLELTQCAVLAITYVALCLNSAF